MKTFDDNIQFTFPFGKYKGKYVDTIPDDYLEWVLTLKSLDESLRAEIKSELVKRAREGTCVTDENKRYKASRYPECDDLDDGLPF